MKITAPAPDMVFRPLPLAAMGLIVLTLLGWGILLNEAMRLGGGAEAFLEALCSPAMVEQSASLVETLSALARSAGLWMAMSVAMMLPTATIMVISYADIADQAHRQGRAAASPFMVMAGYLSVWLMASLVAALVQAVLHQSFKTLLLSEATQMAFAGLALMATGLYQFSPLKSRCLMVCRDCFRLFARRPITRSRDVFKLGFEQGLHCLACTWALMAVMAVVGAMNLIWMVLFSALMAIEKMMPSPQVPRIIGYGFFLAGIAMLCAGFGRL
jgi:predicted metal-binding membrane protein